MDQSEIVDGLCAGDSKAWTVFYDTYYESVCGRVSRLMCGNVHEVADVVQETFLAAARSARQFDPNAGSLWAWVWGIARNQVALHYRKQDRIQRAVERFGERGGQLTSWLNGDKNVGPPQAAEAAELAVLVRATLIDLPQEYGELLTAKYLEGASIEAIAEPTGATASAVRSRLARARRAFRDAFARIAGGLVMQE